MRSEYELSVFINCPFDRRYRKLLHAIVFTVHDCGYIARSAYEIARTSPLRMIKIPQIIAQCRLGIHDLSRTELDRKTKLPHFNMPLELGMFLGAKQFGNPRQQKKIVLLLDRLPDRYRHFCSDLAGLEVSVYGSKVERMIEEVRNFLADAAPARVLIPGSAKIYLRYQRFSAHLPAYCRQLGETQEKLTYRDYAILVQRWLKQPSITAP